MSELSDHKDAYTLLETKCTINEKRSNGDSYSKFKII